MKTLAVILCACALTACRRNMADQAYLRPLAEDTFFRDGSASRPLPPHTVARGQLREDEPFFTGKAGGVLIPKVPLPVTRELLSRGRERFEIYCAVCHGSTGEGNGIVAQRGFPRPPSLRGERLRSAPYGHFFDVITNGYGVMYPYAAHIKPEDRWAIAAYIRELQFGRDAMLDGAEPPAREQPNPLEK